MSINTLKWKPKEKKKIFTYKEKIDKKWSREIIVNIDDD